jgi:deoxyribonuclease-4
MERLFGAHVSAAGGFENALEAATFLGINTIQIHPTPPQRWNSKPTKEGAEKVYLEKLPSSGVKALFFHGIYLINLANPDPKAQELGYLSLKHDLELSARMHARGVIFHVGSMKDEPDEKAGYARAAATINRVMADSPQSSRLILEVAAGSGAIIGDRMEELAEIYAQVEQKDRVGFGLDTQHMWASGYDIAGECEGVVADVERVFGIDKVWAVHLNDSIPERGSRKDRHANLGEGTIGAEGLKRFFNHPKLVNIPFILETPALKDLETAKPEVERLRSFLI